ncbi:MAG: FAD/NAD(P)-binding protein [Gammaproteobacteria bacterium]
MQQPDSSRPLKLVICGGGSAAILLLQSLKQRAQRPIEVTILEPRSRLGVGVAYSTDCPTHLLNTRACNMSVTDDPDDFVRWLKAERPRRVLNWTREDFAPRSYFADYLQARLAETRGVTNLRVSWLHSVADSITPRGRSWEVVPAHGEPITADVVILATGNEPPRVLGRGLAPSVQNRVIEDPWDAERKAEIPADAPVLLTGTSLTAIDIATELLQNGHTAQIIAISRRGILPRSHGPIAAASEGFVHALPSSLREVVRYVREISANDPRGDKWRRVFTELRSIAPSLWRNWTVAERRRFLRHVRPFWDAHRHRLAPRVHGKIERAIASGQLKIVRGRLAAIEQHPTREGLRVSVRHGHATRTIDVAHVVNCTGPEQHPGRSTNPLLQGLIGDDIARPDPLGLGLAVDSESRVIAANGSAHPSLFAVGALTRGTRWEITAIPEMREQANAVVRKLLHDHAEQAVAGARAEAHTGTHGDTVTIASWAAGLQFQSTSVSR